MTNKAENEKIEPKSTQRITFSDSTKMGVLIHLLEIIIQVGKHSQIISISLASLNLLFAVNDFLSNNIGFAILNLMFALVGFMFFIKMRQMSKIHSHELPPNFNKINRKSMVGFGKLK